MEEANWMVPASTRSELGGKFRRTHSTRCRMSMPMSTNTYMHGTLVTSTCTTARTCNVASCASTDTLSHHNPIGRQHNSPRAGSCSPAPGSCGRSAPGNRSPGRPR